MKILPTVQYIPFKRRVHRKRRSVASQSPPPPAAVLLTAVHVQPDGNTLSFVFDDDVVGIDGVGAEQFQCEVEGNPPLLGESIIEFDGAHILIAFAQDVTSATTGTLLSGENILFDGGGHAADGQSVPVTPG